MEHRKLHVPQLVKALSFLLEHLGEWAAAAAAAAASTHNPHFLQEDRDQNPSQSWLLTTDNPVVIRLVYWALWEHKKVPLVPFSKASNYVTKKKDKKLCNDDLLLDLWRIIVLYHHIIWVQIEVWTGVSQLKMWGGTSRNSTVSL